MSLVSISIGLICEYLQVSSVNICRSLLSIYLDLISMSWSYHVSGYSRPGGTESLKYFQNYPRTSLSSISTGIFVYVHGGICVMCRNTANCRWGGTESLKHFQKLPTYVSFVNIYRSLLSMYMGCMYRALGYSQLQIGWHGILKIFLKNKTSV